MGIRNTAEKYGTVAILLHWLIAILIIGLLALGLYMVDLPISLQKLKFYGWHKEFGILVLILATLRIVWRAINPTPELPAYMPTIQKIAALFVHYVFYVFMFAMPITGWIISSAAGLSVSFFGLFLLPNFVTPNQHVMHLFESIHEWLAYGLMVCIGLHIIAVIHHYIVHQDNLLRKIWP